MIHLVTPKLSKMIRAQICFNILVDGDYILIRFGHHPPVFFFAASFEGGIDPKLASAIRAVLYEFRSLAAKAAKAAVSSRAACCSVSCR